MRFPNDPAVISPRIRRALRQGTYEQKEYEAISALVNEDDVVLELGAGIGFMCTVAAKIGKAKSVHTYEANPALISYIASVHDTNDVTNVTVNNALLGKKNPTRWIFIFDKICWPRR